MKGLFKILFIATVVSFVNVFAQDKYECRRLTFDLAQEGFATWSPDGKYIIFQHTDLKDTTGKNGLWKISLDGNGAVQVFSGVAEHATWSPDGRYIVFDADTGNSIKMITAEGGELINFLPDTIHIHNGGLPCWSPDALQIAFKDAEYSLCVYNIETDKIARIFKHEALLPLPGCWSEDGKYVLIALWDKPSMKSTMWKISSDGKERKQITGHHENFYRYLSLSPDGSLLVYGVVEGRYVGLYIMPAEGGISLPLSITSQGHNEGPNWSPDGKKIAFTSTRSGNFDIWVMNVDIDQLKRELQELNKFE
jgi:tricorn protease